jgi:CBS domain-containing protein
VENKPGALRARSIGASASVVEAARLMREEHIGSIPITDDEQLVGMITDRDITTRVVAEAADPKMTSVGDVCSPPSLHAHRRHSMKQSGELSANAATMSPTTTASEVVARLGNR